MKIKQRPEDFVVREGYRFDQDPNGQVWVYRLDKQKVSTLQALERISKEFSVRRRALSVCGLKDKQGRTEQLVGVEGGSLGETEVVQSGDLRLKFLGRSATPLSSDNITANRFEVTVRDLTSAEALRVPESVKEVERTGIVNYFDSQRFGFLKHGQGFIGKQLLRGDWEGALKSFLATPSELDHSDDAKVKRFWKEHWGEWNQRSPQVAGARYAPMLRQLRADPMDFKGAFLHIDQRTRMMALFELQSYLWNEGVKRYLSSQLPPAELLGLRYQAGALVFPRSLPPGKREALWRKTFPLLAHDSTFADEAVKAAALWALSAQGLKVEQMKVPETPQIFFKHEERPMFVMPGKLRVNDPRPDELNRGKVKVNLSFTLPPGAYATLVVRRVLWFAAEGARPLLPQPALSPTPKSKSMGRPAWGQPADSAAQADEAAGHEAAADQPRPRGRERPEKGHTPSRGEPRPENRRAAPSGGPRAGKSAIARDGQRDEKKRQRPSRAPQHLQAGRPSPDAAEAGALEAVQIEGPRGFLARQRARKEAKAQHRAQTEAKIPAGKKKR